MPLGLTLAELNMAELIKSGTEGSVYRGTWHGQNVAVKKFKISTSDDLVRFRRELQLLSEVQHPNITQLLGRNASMQSVRSCVIVHGMHPHTSMLAMLVCSTIPRGHISETEFNLYA